jgi:GNAT superfamily N-acetyltransferase
MSEQSSGNLVFIDPVSGFEIRPISPSEREIVDTVITGSSTESREAAMRETLASLPDGQVFGGYRDGIMVAAYALRKDGLANDLAFIVVLPGERRHGIGRTLLQDALRRSGRRPLAAQTPEDILPFFKACGFKLVGRCVQPDGEVHFRVGWHTPGAKFKGGTTSALKHNPIDGTPRS